LELKNTTSQNETINEVENSDVDEEINTNCILNNLKAKKKKIMIEKNKISNSQEENLIKKEKSNNSGNKLQKLGSTVANEYNKSNFNENDFSWKIFENVENSFLLQDKLKKAYFSKKHSHQLHIYNYIEKGYNPGNWYCDVCKKNYNKEIDNLCCLKCQYDICSDCYYLEVNYIE